MVSSWLHGTENCSAGAGAVRVRQPTWCRLRRARSSRPSSTADDSEAVGIATEAQQEWARVSGDDKARILRQGGDAIEAHTDVLAGWLGREAGSAHGKAAFEAGLVSAEFYLAAGTALMPYGQLLRSAKPRLSMAKRRPVGVVGVISPFNFPGILSARSIAPALALGNAVIH